MQVARICLPAPQLLNKPDASRPHSDCLKCRYDENALPVPFAAYRARTVVPVPVSPPAGPCQTICRGKVIMGRKQGSGEWVQGIAH
jgi:hypothetical protein